MEGKHTGDVAVIIMSRDKSFVIRNPSFWRYVKGIRSSNRRRLLIVCHHATTSGRRPANTVKIPSLSKKALESRRLLHSSHQLSTAAETGQHNIGELIGTGPDRRRSALLLRWTVQDQRIDFGNRHIGHPSARNRRRRFGTLGISYACNDLLHEIQPISREDPGAGVGAVRKKRDHYDVICVGNGHLPSEHLRVAKASASFLIGWRSPPLSFQRAPGVDGRRCSLC